MSASATDNVVGPEPHGQPPSNEVDITVIWDSIDATRTPSQRKGCAIGVWRGAPLLMGGDGGRGVRFNDVHILGKESNVWNEIQCHPGVDGYMPANISYHAMVIWRQYAIVFGGYDNNHTNDVRRLDLETRTWDWCRTRGPTPEKRYGHTMCLWRNQAIVMGGQLAAGTVSDDLYFLDLPSMTWSEIVARGERPAPSCYHTMSIWNNYAVVFGGTDSPDVYLLDLEELFWTRIVPGGVTPTRRFGHTAAVWHDLCVFACGRRESTCNSEILVLSLGVEAMYWVPLDIDTSTLGERHAHAMVVVNDRLIIFGGHGGTYYNDTHILALDTMKWLPIAFTPIQRDGHAMFIWRDRVYLWGGDGGGGRRFQDLNVFESDRRLWRRCDQGGEIPTRRSYHATDVWGDMLVMFGGYDASFTADLHIMDLNTTEWVPVEQAGAIPAPRYGHTLTVYGNCAYVFGGKGSTSKYFGPEVARLNLRTLVWDTLETRGTPPAKRYGHCAFLRGKHLCIFGGSGNAFHNDLFSLDLETGQWREIDTIGTRPIARSYHAVAMWGERVVVCGGDHGGGQRLNDLHVLDLRSNRWQVLAVRGDPPPIRCAHKIVVLNNKALIFGGRDAGTYFNDLRYLTLDPSVDAVARLFCTLSLIHEHSLLEQLRPSPDTAAIAAFLEVTQKLPSELVMHICTFVVDVPPGHLPSDALLAEIRGQMTSPEQSRRWAIGVVVVEVTEAVLGNLDLVPKVSFKGHLVRSLMARVRNRIAVMMQRGAARVAADGLGSPDGRRAIASSLIELMATRGDAWDVDE